MPTVGQRAVHFRTLAIIGVAAACGLSASASQAPAPLSPMCNFTPCFVSATQYSLTTYLLLPVTLHSVLRS